MENTPANYLQYATRNGAYRDLDALQQGYGPWDAKKIAEVEVDKDVKNMSWLTSGSNPVNRVNSLEPLPETASSWRIDGTERAGMRFLATPVFATAIIPTRIDVYIPDPSSLSGHLRRSLDIGHNTHIRDGRIKNLGIHHHLIRALKCWSQSMQNFEALYRSLPFGSRIAFRNISEDPASMIAMVEYSGVHTKLLTVDELSHRHVRKELPPEIELGSLTLVRGLNDNVCIVRTMLSSLPDLYIFKSSTTKPGDIYHELDILLRLRGIPHICSSPIRLVKTTGLSGHGGQVIGFLLEYYTLGSLRDVLPHLTSTNCLPLPLKLKWAKQLIGVLQSLRNAHNMFYSDLKPENILLTSVTKYNTKRVKAISLQRETWKEDYSDTHLVLIDFQQTGAPNAWTAPEIYYTERLIFLWKKSKNDPQRRQEYLSMLQILLPPKALSAIIAAEDDQVLSVTQTIWGNLSSHEQEAAMVFALGKVLWCIFEGAGCVTSMMSASFSWEERFNAIEFPEFSSLTPPALRSLILECTAGAREHAQYDGSKIYITRFGDHLYPGGSAGRKPRGESRGTASDFVTAARQYWLDEIKDLRNFVEAKGRLQADPSQTKTPSIEIHAPYLAYLRRPNLKDVLSCLDTLSA